MDSFGTKNTNILKIRRRVIKWSSYQADVNCVEEERNLGVYEGFVGPSDRFDDVRLHLAGGDSAPRSQRCVTVQHHDVDLFACFGDS